MTRFTTALALTLAGLLPGCGGSAGVVEEVAVSAATTAPAVTGVALYRERIALPPGAVFEASLQDIARAGAPALIIGRTIVTDPTPPIHFSIPYDPAEITPRGRYSVRATIHVDGQLRFTSDTVHPVLRHDGDNEVEILLRAAGSAPLRLPATFRGDVPCADCEGIRHHLDLWPDQVFHLRREWVGKEDAQVRGDMGRWRVDPARRALVLHGGAEMPLQFEILGPDRLRLLDLVGHPFESNLPYELDSIGRIEMADVPQFFLGHMSYMADSPRLTECLTGRSYPIAPGEEALKMQREYLARVETPGADLLMHFDGVLTQRPGMEGGRLEPTLVVERFIAARPGDACPRTEPINNPALSTVTGD